MLTDLLLQQTPGGYLVNCTWLCFFYLIFFFFNLKINPVHKIKIIAMPKRSGSAIGVQLTQQQRSSSYKSRKSLQHTVPEFYFSFIFKIKLICHLPFLKMGFCWEILLIFDSASGCLNPTFRPAQTDRQTKTSARTFWFLLNPMTFFSFSCFDSWTLLDWQAWSLLACDTTAKLTKD